MHAICVDAHTNNAMIYDCAEQYAMHVSVSSALICCGRGNPRDYYGIDDVRIVVPKIDKTVQKYAK